MNPNVVAAEKFAFSNLNVLRVIEVSKTFSEDVLGPYTDDIQIVSHGKLVREEGSVLLIIPQEPAELFIKGNLDNEEIDRFFRENRQGFSMKHVYNKVFKGIKRVDPYPFFIK
jgi:hypothetical protein